MLDTGECSSSERYGVYVWQCGSMVRVCKDASARVPCSQVLTEQFSWLSDTWKCCSSSNNNSGRLYWQWLSIGSSPATAKGSRCQPYDHNNLPLGGGGDSRGRCYDQLYLEHFTRMIANTPWVAVDPAGALVSIAAVVVVVREVTWVCWRCVDGVAISISFGHAGAPFLVAANVEAVWYWSDIITRQHYCCQVTTSP